jgi:hypothetical protein
VVMTCALSTILCGHNEHKYRDPSAHVFTEEDHTNLNECSNVARMQTLAERTAWDLVRFLPKDRKFELVTVHSSPLVLGTINRLHY